MSQLMDFLIENPIDDITEKVVFSKRLPQDQPFEIRAMRSEEFFSLQKSATKFKKGQKIDFDSKKFNESIVINHTAVPNFKDAEFIQKAGCHTPEQLLNKVLLSGEISELAERIISLSGFDTELDELVAEAKNS